MRTPLFNAIRAYLRHLWFFKATTEGKLLVGSIIVSAGVSALSLEIPSHYLFCGLWVLGATAFVVNWLLRPAVRVEGHFPDSAVAGQPTAGRFRLINESMRAAHDLSVGFFQLPRSIDEVDAGRTVASLEPGEAASIPVTLRAWRRGAYALPRERAYTTFPLNLCRAGVKRRNGTGGEQARSLLVLPSFHPLAGIDVPVNERHQPGGIALSSHIGQSPEYIGNREYRPGDSPRRLDYRSWARLARPVVREYQEEYYCRIALVLDTYVPGRRRVPRKGFPNLEAAVSLSAAVADALARGEYIIDIFAAGPELYVFRAGRHTAHFDNVLEILACVDACRTNPFEVVTPALADELGSISTLVAVLLDWDGPREGLVRAAVEAGCSVKVVIVRDGQTTEPFDAVEGEYAISQLAPADVQRGGIETL